MKKMFGPTSMYLVSARAVKIKLCITYIELTINIKYTYFLVYKYNITSTSG